MGGNWIYEVMCFWIYGRWMRRAHWRFPRAQALLHPNTVLQASPPLLKCLPPPPVHWSETWPPCWCPVTYHLSGPGPVSAPEQLLGSWAEMGAQRQRQRSLPEWFRPQWLGAWRQGGVPSSVHIFSAQHVWMNNLRSRKM